MKKGIDVSTHNGNLNWEKIKAAGIEFVMIRAGYGNNNIDKQFKRNISECNRLGIPCGVYWFSYALTADMARNEAKHCIEAIKNYKVEYPVAFDLEYDSVNYAKKNGVTIEKKLASEFAKAFCGEVERQGYCTLVYGNSAYLNGYFDEEVNRLYGRWLASWNNKTDPPMSCQIWQWSNSGSIEGVNSRFDLNRSYVDYPALVRERGLNGFKVEKPAVNEWWKEAAEWAVANGITDGTYLDQPCTRAQVITMLHRYHKKFFEVK